MTNPITWIVEKARHTNDIIWRTSLSDISKGRSFVIKQLRIIVLAARGFMNDRVQLRASALTLYSILSIIPFIAIAFGVAKGFALDQKLQEIFAKEFQSQPEVLNWITNQATAALQATRGGYIAGIGIIILIWSAMSMLDQIESSFNHIWQIKSSRPWYRKFTDYLAIMLFAPVFLILSSSITVFVNQELTEFMARSAILEFFKPIIGFLIKLAPYLLTWISLTVLFIILPNTKVNIKPAIISGIVAGTILQFLQWLYIDLQFGITNLSAIYGSFAAIPLFLIWVQSSWIILLLGAELSFANQNISRYEFEYEALEVSHFQKRALVLMILSRIVKNFSNGEKPISSESISQSLKIPARLVMEILQDLQSAGLVSVIHENEHEERLFQPALDINRLSVSFIMNRLDRRGTDQQVFVKTAEYNKIASMLDKFEVLIAGSDTNVLVKDL
jgi:membrane protein